MNIQLINPSGTPEEIHHLQEIERLAWSSDGENIAASGEKIHRRVECFSSGVTIALCGREAAGSQFAFQFHWDGNTGALGSWDDMTSDGHYEKVHVPNAGTGFLVGVGVVPRFRGLRVGHSERWQQGMKVSELLIARTLDTLLLHGSSRVIGNARIPWYHKKPDLEVEEYCSLRRPDGKLFDPVLRFHERMGARIIKPVSYSMEDAESRDAGCWVCYERRFEKYS